MRTETIHVLTACTRPGNLGPIADSIFSSKPFGVDVEWHVRHDHEPAVGGQRVKNEMLEGIERGWVCFLDDDTLMHPRFLERICDETRAEVDLIFFGQQRHGTEQPPDVRRGIVDIGQVCVRREVIGDTEIPDFYDGDGWFCEALVQNSVGALYLPEVLSFYNALA